MLPRLPPLSTLRTFLVAATRLNFRQAASDLHVTPAAVSQQIRSLEDYLGCSLFERSPRSLRLTPAGMALLPGIRDGFACFAEALAQLPAVRPEGTLHVGAPAAFASRWLVPHLGEFNRRHPEITLHLGSAPDYVDATVIPQPLIPDAVDVLIRYGHGHYPGQASLRLQTGDYLAVCAPALWRPELPFAAWLARQTLLHDASIPLPEQRPNWGEWCRLAGLDGINCRQGPSFSNAVLVHEAALAGQGVALMQRAHITDDLADGRLQICHRQALPSAYAYYLLLRQPATPAAKVFADWLQARCASADIVTPPDNGAA
ncbi:LysR substrate-binding domain-containing protein [Dechloromonas sp. ZY10]|uniref:LysR substrate-binding domain-containing protein n=1 Tax=Dechloromonas aquae TaxID=2664436 RepID=UPI0035274D5D